ncbi:MAG: helix-turn-helix domain-containing protein [Nanoarchaeota archaeon]
MAICELCGEDTNLKNTRVEGSVVKACHRCQRLGKVLEEDTSASHSFYRKKKTRTEFVVVDDFQARVSRAMAKQSLDAKKLGLKSNIKESSLTKYLSGKIPIDVDTARKLEKSLGITLVEEGEVSEINADDFTVDSGDSSGLSLGDLIAKQMKK